MEQINLNIIPNGAMPVCHVSQYDKGRTIRLNLFDGDNVYTLTGDETLELDVKKPDTTIVTANVVNTSDTYVEIVTTEQMAACSGNNFCELRISMGGAIIGSLNFIMACEKSPLEGGVESESAIENLDTQVAALVAEEVASQYDASDVIFDSEPTEGHGIGYAVTSEGVFNAINNALDFEDEAGPASIVSFDNAAALPVVELVANITAQQASGTPTPVSPIPITGFSQADIVVSPYYIMNFVQGGISDGTGEDISSTIRLRCDYIGFDGNVLDLFINKSQTNEIIRSVHFYDGTYNYLGVESITASTAHITSIPTDTKYIRIVLMFTTNVDITYQDEAVIINDTIYTVAFGQTIYGGRLIYANGQWSIDAAHGMVDLSTLTWVEQGLNTGVYRAIDFDSSNIDAPTGYNETPDLIAEDYVTSNWGAIVDNHLSNAITVRNVGTAATPDIRLIVSNTTPTGKMVYELETPVIIPITSSTRVKTISGDNNIFSNTGDIERIVYFKDSAQAIADLINIILNEIDS